MKFKVGDKVRRLEKHRTDNWKGYCKTDFSPSQNPNGIFEIIHIGGEGIKLEYNTDGYFYSESQFELGTEKANNEISNKKMTKKSVYNVLVVNKKTGKIEKDKTVVADGEKHAILRAYDIDVERLSFTVTQRAEFEEDKPQTVVLEKEPK